MGATSSAGGEPQKDYELVEAGAYPARCVHVIELGTHDNEWKGEIKKRKELMIVWELSDELMEDGRPFVIKWQGTNSLSENAHLYRHLTDWRGRKFTADELKLFDLGSILDKTCMINVTADPSKKDPTKVYNNLKSVMPLPKGMELQNERHNPLVNFGINDIDTPLFEELWPFVQKKILASDEGQRYGQGLPFEEPEERDGEDTPF